MTGEQAYVQKCRATNPKLFAAAKIQLTPSALEKVILDAYRTGQGDALSRKVDDLWGRFEKLGKRGDR